MSDYRRLISYIYEYEGKEKGKNVGFVKLEARNGQCRLNLSVKKVYVGGNAIGVYLLGKSGRETFLGNIFIRNGSGEFRATVDAANVESSGNGLDTYYGLTVHDVKNPWRSYTTIWEDAVQPEISGTQENSLPQLPAGDAVKMLPAQEILPGSRDLRPVPAVSSVVKEIEAEIAREEERRNQEEASLAHAAEVGAETREEMEAEAAVEAAMQPEAPVSPLDSAAQAAPSDLQPAAPAVQPAIAFPALQPATATPRPAAPVPQPAAPAVQPATAILQSAIPVPQPEASAPQATVPAPRPAAPTAQPAVPILQAAPPAAPPAAPAPQPAAPWSATTAAQATTAAPQPAASAPRSATTAAQAITAAAQPAAPAPQPAAPQSTTTAAQATTPDPQPEIPAPQTKAPTPQPAGLREEIPMRSPELENPDVLRYLQETEDVTADPEKLWQELRKSYPKIQPFDYEGGCEILTIRPQDIGRLPRESWVYGNNSFLLHGYYNFRYIILFRLGNKDGRPRYLLGVPGHYYSSEKYMASMFGFPNFVLSKKQPPNDGRFGYWYTDIRVR